MWTPKPERASQTDMARFMGLAGKRSYDELHAWSVAERGAFWNLLWEFCEGKGQKGARALVDGDRMPGALWFPDARLNFAENLLRSRDHRDAIVFWGADRVTRRRRLFLRRQGVRFAGKGRTSPGEAAFGGGVRRHRLPWRPGHGRNLALRLPRPVRRRRNPFRAARVQSSPLHRLLVGHHRCAEV